MASSLRLPAGSLFSAARPSNAVFYPRAISSSSAAASCQCRYFSQGPQRSAGMRGVPQDIAMKQPAQPSMKSRGREMSRADLPQDIGLLPGTFIRPLWRDMPSIFQQPRQRLQLEWLWLKSGFQNFLSLVAYCKWMNKSMPLRLKERRQVGRELHKRMYTAFATGDQNTLRKICCTGLATNLSSRINNRPKDEKVTWTLDRYIRSPSTLCTGVRVLSDRATQIPEIAKSGVRQVVLRITSKQSTGKVKVPSKRSAAVTEEAPVPAKQQDCTEYIVLQKLMWYGEEEGWRIWGHTTASTVEDLDNPMFASGLTLYERMEAMKEMMGGKK